MKELTLRSFFTITLRSIIITFFCLFLTARLSMLTQKMIFFVKDFVFNVNKRAENCGFIFIYCSRP